MKACNGRRSPRLSLCALGLAPDNRLPIRFEGKHAARNDLDSIAAGLVGIEEEALGYGALNEYAML